jgi:formylglycine-generating enzyme required for sulfatase activity
MVRIPDATFLMGSDRHHPEEAAAHPVGVERPSGSTCGKGPLR